MLVNRSVESGVGQERTVKTEMGTSVSLCI